MAKDRPLYSEQDRCSHGTVIKSTQYVLTGGVVEMGNVYTWNCGKCNPDPEPRLKYEQLTLF